jgi:putative peptidoglycan lipid II flippase
MTMAEITGKHALLSRFAKTGGSTAISRILGLIRETLMARYLGAGAISDAFVTAWKIPNFMRKIFAEGALTASFVPTLTEIFKKDSQKGASRLMSLAFIFFEGILLCICLLFFIFAWYVIKIISPGFTPEQVVYAVPFLRLLIGIILFISCSALLACALNAVNSFVVPAISPAVMNVFFISGITAGLLFGLSVNWLCVFILAGAIAQFLMHLFMYFKVNFTFAPIDAQTWANFRVLLRRFLPCMFGMSILEIHFFIDTSIASFLAAGSLTRVYYAERFMQLPLSILGIALATVLLTHFSRVSLYAPRRLSFYLYEATKFVFWLVVPITFMMMFFSYEIFSTLMVSSKFTIADALITKYIFIAFIIGLFFYSINKILINVFYSLRDTRRPTILSMIATGVNIVLNVALVLRYGSTGTAVATSLSGIFQTIMLFYYLHKDHKINLYMSRLINFCLRSLVQMACMLTVGYGVYRLCVYAIIHTTSPVLQAWLLTKVLFWLWALPLCITVLLGMFLTRKLFGIRMYFID